MVHKVQGIYNHMKDCLENKQSFSICRMGNAEVSTIHTGILSPMRSITQGIPESSTLELLELLKHSANTCDYVSSMGTWLTEDYFEKNIKKDSIYRQWKEIHQEFGITNINYCNPDIGYLMFMEGEYNLWNLIKDKRIGIITSKLELWNKMDVDLLIRVPEMTTRPEYQKGMTEPLYGWHWEEYESIKRTIGSLVKDIDIFLIGAGYLAKGYSAYIKELGGISLDVGKVMDTWNGEGLNRMTNWIEESADFAFNLTEAGKQYEGKF